MSEKVGEFMEKIQSLYKSSSIYSWPFSKVESQIRSIQGQIKLKEKSDKNVVDEKSSRFFNGLHLMASQAMLKSHLWEVDQLKQFASQKVDFGAIKNDNSRLLLLHFTEIAIAADFFIEKRAVNEENFDVNFSIDSKTSVDFVKNFILPALLDTEKPKEVVVVFFEENLNVANMIDRMVFDNPPKNWNEKTKLFILTDNSFEMPAHLILSFKLFALE